MMDQLVSNRMTVYSRTPVNTCDATDIRQSSVVEEGSPLIIKPKQF